MYITSVVALAAVLCVAAGQVQRETIPEAISKGAVASVAAGPSGQPPAMSDLLMSTDLLAAGIVGESHSYLSADQTEVFTDYPLYNPTVFYRANVVRSRTPIVTPGVTVSLRGGTVTVNGTKFTQTEYGMPKLTTGMHALFLLREVDGKYWLAGTFYGAFSVKNGNLSRLSERIDFAREYENVPVDEAVKSMLGTLRTKGQHK